MTDYIPPQRSTKAVSNVSDDRRAAKLRCNFVSKNIPKKFFVAAPFRLFSVIFALCARCTYAVSVGNTTY